jgi:hypothetical protein
MVEDFGGFCRGLILLQKIKSGLHPFAGGFVNDLSSSQALLTGV